MNIVFNIAKLLITSFLLSAVLTPVVKRIGFSIDAYAVENNRTVHHGKIVRIGGIAIFIAFIITMALYEKADTTYNAILIGSLFVFLGGLLDDIYDLKPMIKMGFQIAGALYVILVGNVSLSEISLSIMHIDFKPISFIVTLFWIVGVTNAINLIDGLDGLSCGLSIIVLSVIGFIGYFMGRTDVSIISLILIGSIGGFLLFNFHPASIFVGDCGAQFMGYMIACLALLGFKTTTFITLGFPIIILFVPLADTSVAIIRRKLKGVSFSQADKSHFHHILMYKVGLSHRNTVLSIYLVSALFGLCAILTYFHRTIGIMMLFVLCVIAWLFIELTGMINPRFHPVISFIRSKTGLFKISDDAKFEANKTKNN